MMTEQLAAQLTEDEALAVMAQGLSAFVHDNGPDLEAESQQTSQSAR